jgi:uncharacterized membrane protein YdcZ (DUF606 family)
MRSIAPAVMSFGAISFAFGFVVLVIMLLAKVNAHPGIAEMTTLGMLAVLAGAALIALGFFMSRMGGRRDT